MLPWLPRVAAVLALGAAVMFGGPYVWNMIANRPKKPEPVARQPQQTQPATAAARPPSTPAARRRTTGSLEITTTPPGAQVIVDGKPRGVTPLTLADLAAGRHIVELKSSAGTVERTVTIAADQTAQLEESIFSGWLAVHSPFDVVISEGNRALTLDDRSQVMLPPGRHQVRVVNRALAYDVVHPVDLKPGETTHLTVNPAPSTLTLTVERDRGVWLDGEKAGRHAADGGARGARHARLARAARERWRAAVDGYGDGEPVRAAHRLLAAVAARGKARRAREGSGFRVLGSGLVRVLGSGFWVRARHPERPNPEPDPNPEPEPRTQNPEP